MRCGVWGSETGGEELWGVRELERREKGVLPRTVVDEDEHLWRLQDT